MMADELASICETHRLLALQQPVDIWKLRKARMHPEVLRRYSFQWGKYTVSITYETHTAPPQWHAQVSILEAVSELEYGAMQEALLATQSWTDEDRSEAADILGECLAPEILSPSQEVTMHMGLWSWHSSTIDQRSGERGNREERGPGIIIASKYSH